MHTITVTITDHVYNVCLPQMGGGAEDVLPTLRYNNERAGAMSAGRLHGKIYINISLYFRIFLSTIFHVVFCLPFLNMC